MYIYGNDYTTSDTLIAIACVRFALCLTDWLLVGLDLASLGSLVQINWVMRLNLKCRHSLNICNSIAIEFNRGDIKQLLRHNASTRNGIDGLSICELLLTQLRVLADIYEFVSKKWQFIDLIGKNERKLCRKFMNAACQLWGVNYDSELASQKKLWFIYSSKKKFKVIFAQL